MWGRIPPPPPPLLFVGTNTRSTIVDLTRRKRRHETTILRKRSFVEPGVMNRLLSLSIKTDLRSNSDSLVRIVLQQLLHQIDSVP